MNALHSRAIACLFLLTSCSTAHSFYATPMQPMHLLPVVPPAKDGSTTLSVGLTQTDGSEALNSAAKKVSFMEQHGTAKFRNLYKGLDQPTGEDSLAYRYFNDNGAQALVTDENMTAKADTDATLRFNSPGNRYWSKSVLVSLTQHLFTGLFVQVNTQIVDQTLRQRASASGPNSGDARITDFVSKFDAFLEEHAIAQTSNYHRAGSLERITVMAGWGGHTILRNSVFQEMSGSLTTGYTVTPPTFNNPLSPAMLPHSLSDGVILRVTGHAQIARFLAADIDLSSTVYIQRRGHMHIVRDDVAADADAYTGPVLLGKGYVKRDPGTLWTAHASIGVNRIASLFANIGYQYSYQEATRVEARADDYLTGLATTPVKRKARLDSDPRNQKWKFHAVTLSFGFTPESSSHRFLPELHIRLAYPISYGVNSVFPGYVISGSGQLCAQWRF